MREYLTNNRFIDRCNQPVIIGVTGHFAEQFKMIGGEAGMDDVLSKPIYYKTLVQLLLKYGLVENEK